jgi:hypothetical protein
MVHRHCMQDTEGYKHRLRICNTYCFFTATVVVRAPLSIMLYVCCCLVQNCNFKVSSHVNYTALLSFKCSSHTLDQILDQFSIFPFITWPQWLLAIYSVVVTLPTICFNTKKCSILPTLSVYMFHMTLTVNSHFFPLCIITDWSLQRRCCVFCAVGICFLNVSVHSFENKQCKFTQFASKTKTKPVPSERKVSQYVFRRMFGTLLVRCDGPMICNLFCPSSLSDSTVCLNHIAQGRPICLFPLDFIPNASLMSLFCEHKQIIDPHGSSTQSHFRIPVKVK